MQANYKVTVIDHYKVTVIDHDYHYTKYETWVSATSKNQALVKAGNLIGGEKTRREWLRMGREPIPETLIEPDVRIEIADPDLFWNLQDTVTVTS